MAGNGCKACLPSAIHMTEFFLTTARLTLRDMRVSDEDDFVALSQQPGYQTYYDEADGQPEHYRYLTRLFVEQAAQCPRLAYQLAVIDNESDIFIGIACLRMEPRQRAAIGFGLHPHWQGQGLMREAMQALISFAVKEYSLDYIYAETLQENRAAVALCRALGLFPCSSDTEQRYFKGRSWQTLTLEKRTTDD